MRYVFRENYALTTEFPNLDQSDLKMEGILMFNISNTSFESSSFICDNDWGYEYLIDMKIIIFVFQQGPVFKNKSFL